MLKNIVGATVRSRNGCNFCKKRRRKCDEVHPACGFCVKKGIDCVYKVKGNGKEFEKDKFEKDKLEKDKFEKDSFDVGKVESEEEAVKFEIEPVVGVSDGEAVFEEVKNTDSSLFPYQTDPSMDQFPFYIQPTSSVFLFVDETGAFYIDYFKNHVTSALCVSKSNYFEKLYCKLANEEETFALSIAAWGGLYYKNKQMDGEINKYLARSLIKFTENFKHSSSKINCYFQICFYLILVGFNICSGDTYNWNRIMEDCNDSITRYGGIEKLCEDFSYSNEVRFLISNFQYHDVLSLSSVQNGTKIPMETYKRLFGHFNFKQTEASYGLDTLQGCSQPILLVLGDILEAKTSSKKNPLMACNEKQEELLEKIETAHPNFELTETLSPQELQLHLTAFELYRLCCRMHWLLYIKRVSPLSLEVQKCGMQTMELVDILIQTNLRVIVTLPLLMCGLSSVDLVSKERVTRTFKYLNQTCPVNNVSKCWTIVRISWEMNRDGSKIIDWSDICEKFNWYLNVC